MFVQKWVAIFEVSQEMSTHPSILPSCDGNHIESWGPKNWCFWTMVLEKTLKSPLDCKEIQTVHPKGNQFWIFTGRTDTEAPILWLPNAKNWLTGKDPDAGKDWRQEEKGMRDDEKLQYSSYLMWRTDSLEKTLMLGKIEGRKRRGWEKIRWPNEMSWHHQFD